MNPVAFTHLASSAQLEGLQKLIQQNIQQSFGVFANSPNGLASSSSTRTYSSESGLGSRLNITA